MPKQVWVNVGGVWRKVHTVWVNVGGVWKQATPKLNVGGVWKDVQVPGVFTESFENFNITSWFSWERSLQLTENDSYRKIDTTYVRTGSKSLYVNIYPAVRYSDYSGIPSPGKRFSAWFYRPSSSRCCGALGFGLHPYGEYVGPNLYGPAGYSVAFEFPSSGNSTLSIYRHYALIPEPVAFGSDVLATVNISNPSNFVNAWFKLEVEWHTDGTIRARLYYPSEVLAHEISTVDTTYTSGGFGFGGDFTDTDKKSTETWTVYIDDYEMTNL